MHIDDYIEHARNRAPFPLLGRTRPPPQPNPEMCPSLPVDIDVPLGTLPPAPEWLPGSVDPHGDSPPRGDGPPSIEHRRERPVLVPDALAYYLPFHFYVPMDWGIYVLESGVASLAVEIAGGRWDPAAVPVAFDALLEHELQHCVAEIGMTRIEMQVAPPVYLPWFNHPQAYFLEEAMANARSSRAVRRRAAVYSPAFDAAMKRCGPGYRDFNRYLSRTDFLEGEHLCALLGHRLAGSRGAAGRLHFLMDPSVTPRPSEVPLHLVMDQRPGRPRLPGYLWAQLVARANRVLVIR